MTREESTDRVEQKIKEKIDERRKLYMELEMVEEQILELADHLGDEDNVE